MILAWLLCEQNSQGDPLESFRAGTSGSQENKLRGQGTAQRRHCFLLATPSICSHHKPATAIAALYARIAQHHKGADCTCLASKRKPQFPQHQAVARKDLNSSVPRRVTALSMLGCERRKGRLQSSALSSWSLLCMGGLWELPTFQLPTWK